MLPREYFDGWFARIRGATYHPKACEYWRMGWGDADKEYSIELTWYE